MKNRLFLIIYLLTTLTDLVKAGSSGFRFIENKGQWHEDVLYRGAIPGGDIYVLKNKLKYVFYPSGRINHEHGLSTESGTALRAQTQPKELAQAVEVLFVGANEQSAIKSQTRFPETINYIKGNNQDRWVTDAGAFAIVTISDLYPGIDLNLYSTVNGLKYDFVLKPGANPANIRMQYQGQDYLKIHNDQLVFGTMFGQVHESRPVCYTEEQGVRKEVKATFQLDDQSVSFAIEIYDTTKTLVIDPELIFSTYSGSFADNWGFTATFDDEGNLYSGGIVSDEGYPVTTGVFQLEHGGEWDVGILKYTPDGKELVYATYIGGSFTETPQSIIVNHRGELVIYGTTSSPDFPMTGNSYNAVFSGGESINDEPDDEELPILVGGVSFLNGSDLFVAILSADGKSLEGATFVGGTGNDGLMERTRPLTKNYGDEFRGEVIVDNSDNIYVASNTSSVDFPITGGWQATYGGGFNDGVVMKLSPDASQLLWSTFVGGSGMDALFSVKVDKTGNVFAAGGSISVDFPVTEGTLKTSKPSGTDIDGVLVKISSDGSQLLRSTFLGTSSYDQVYCLEIDSSSRVYVLGQTQGLYPVTAGVYSNPNSGQFIHKISNDLDFTFFSTVIGSGTRSPNFSPTAFLVNECENIFLSGWGGVLNRPSLGYIGGNTLSLPITSNAFLKTTDGSDFYLMVLLQDARQLLYGSYFGENGRGDHVDGGTSRFDKRGIIYHSVCGGCGGSSEFPTWPPDVWSPTNNSDNCNNAAFKFDLASLEARFETDTEDFTNRGIRSGCYPFTLVFLNESVGGENFFWEFGNGSSTDQEDSITVTYDIPGTYPVVLTATDINTCTRVSEATGSITVYDYDFEIMPEDSICYGSNIELAANGGINYQWTPAQSLENPNTPNPIASPDSTTMYHVNIIDQNGCTGIDSVLIRVIPKIQATFDVKKVFDCHEPPLLKFINQSEGAGFYVWNFGDGNTSEEMEPAHQFAPSDSAKSFNVILQAGQSFCTVSTTLPVSTVSPFVPNVITPNGDGTNDAFEIRVDGQASLQIFNRWGLNVYKSDQYQNDWQGGDLASGVYFYEIVFSDKNTRCNGWVQVLR
ncbi:MAG: gliding motility-associated C-terminal domain-containing protein [Cyclobacteriaceae bacterium]|nr:gliding motility-associated C-terminal domain-containing protein [Cyclobacteriaceae bacterium]